MSDGRGPAISVVIATRDRPRILTGCLQALTEQTLDPRDFEVLVIDDGGRSPLDATVAPFRERVRLVRQEGGGAGAARNTGARHAQGRFLAFTDDDCRPAPDWLGALRARFDADPTALYGGRVLNGLAGNAYAAASQHILEAAYAHHNRDPDDARFFASLNMALPADAFARVGGFDTTFAVASEDRDLCARWREAGLRLKWAPEALVVHAHHLTLASFWRQQFRYGRGARRFRRALERRHGPRPDEGSHAGFVSGALRGTDARTAALLGVWQVANAAGYAWEGLAGLSDRAARA